MIRTYLALGALAAYLTDSYTRLKDDEDGLTTTEIAVVTFLLVGAAIVVMGIIYAAARNNANNIPVPDAPA
jgi:sulfite exporter TauE/SafE